jgi:tetratricopeptide (TPR) repeat protein
VHFRFVTALAFLVALLMLAGSAAAQGGPQNDDEARVHFRLGTAYYDSGRFAQAAQEYKQAYDLSKRPELLYNLFLAYRDAGDIALAADALRQYLADAPNIQERKKLEARLEALEKILADQPPAPATTEAQTNLQSEAAQSSIPEPAPTAPPPERKLTWLPWTLLGVGGAMVVGGVVTGKLASDDEHELEQRCPNESKCSLSEAEVEHLQSSGSSKAKVGDALWISGAVTAGMGLAFVFWRPWDRTGEAPTARVDLDCGRSACRATWIQRF